MVLEVWTCEKILYHFARVSVPNIVLRSLPLWMACRSGEGAVILETRILPLDAAKLDPIDLPVKILMVHDGRGVVVRNKCGGPDFEKPVNLPLGEFGISEEEFRKFETGSRCKR